MGKKYKIVYDREGCIGAAACISVAPNSWKMGDDGKADQLVHEFDEKDLIPNEEAIITLTEDGYIKRMIKGSLRSVKRDISKLAKLLGGGGHKKAAGFTVAGRIVVDVHGRPSIVN
jgi:ferredoxin